MDRATDRLAARAFAAAAGVTTLSVLAVTGASTSGAATENLPQVSAAAAVATAASAVPGARLWVRHYNGPANAFDGATSAATSPAGGVVFVTGDSTGATSRSDYATLAYNAATGKRLWVSRYNGTGNSDDYQPSLAVSPGGGEVFVTGHSRGAGTGDDFATVAYSASTGSELWARRYNGPANRSDGASAIAVSPTGRAVFVTGESMGKTSGTDYVTIAYNTVTGARLWVRRYNGPGNRGDFAARLAVSPRGGKVFVTGQSAGKTSGADYATVAYNAATGATSWVSRYNSQANKFDRAAVLTVGPGGGKVFVTGESIGATSGADYATVAYNAATGAQVWVRRYNGPANRDDVANSAAVSPGGGMVFVTGTSNSVGLDLFDAAIQGVDMPSPDYATVAYSTSTGAQLWVRRYNGQGNGLDFAYSVAVGRTGHTVFVTGFSIVAASGADYATLAYNAATGTPQWVRRYNGPANRNDAASSMAVRPGGKSVFVTGITTGLTSGQDFTTIAYRS